MLSGSFVRRLRLPATTDRGRRWFGRRMMSEYMRVEPEGVRDFVLSEDEERSIQIALQGRG